jgi:acetyltransferase-like isoleucine patch superfamily enzyme
MMMRRYVHSLLKGGGNGYRLEQAAQQLRRGLADAGARLSAAVLTPNFVGAARRPRPSSLYRSARLTGTVSVEHPTALSSAAINGDCAIGAFTYLNPRVEITNSRLGRFCSIAPEVIINPGAHPTDWLSTHPFTCDPSGVSAGMSNVPEYHQLAHSEPARSHNENRRAGTDIGHDIWIGHRAIIMGGLKIGTGAVVAAGAVVTHDVEPYSIVGGIPARHIKYRFTKAMIDRLLASEWWEYDLSLLGQSVDYSQPETALSLIEAGRCSGKLSRAIYPLYRVTSAGISKV